MQVGMLGPLEVRDDAGELVPVGGTRLRALLILLALDPSAMVGTNRLVEALWGEQTPAEVGNALQSLVSRLRRAVPGLSVLTRPAGYQLDLEPDRVDTVRFERLVSAGRATLRDDPARAATILRGALALWRGPALADVAGTDFARSAIVRLDELRLTAIQDRVDADLLLGVDDCLVAELEGLVAANPLREPLIARFIRALAAAGRRAEALGAYERARGRMVEELGIQPSAELAALHLALLRAEPYARPPAAAGATAAAPAPTAAGTAGLAAAGAGTGGPALAGGGTGGPALAGRGTGAAAAEPARTNLRAELTSFVGRGEDLAQVGKLLAAYRMTTLTGPGGAGKTRLAVAAARTRLDLMPDGVWLVELAPVSDPAEVAPAILEALGLRQLATMRGTRPRVADESGEPADRLVAALSDKQALLVLDNCEHLIGTAAVLADRILGDCPGMTILATSREPLSIAGEMLCPVPPLALPPETAEPESVGNYASVRLLTHRAAAVRPDFEVNAGNALAVARICRALDGMPLAIELAAARLRAMTPRQLAARLDDRFRLLTGGRRTALARHQTLAAVVGWSWDLLDDAERALWRRLSVFAGGASLEAAERVCAGGPVAADRILDLLTALVDKSLLVMREDAGQPRYQMLEIIKAYGQERLVEAGEGSRLRLAHASYFLKLAETAQEHLLRAEQLEWLVRLTADHDNLHAAVRNTVAAGHASVAARLVGALGWYWWFHGHRAEGTELAAEALSLLDGEHGWVAAETQVVAYAIGALLALDSRQEPDVPLSRFQAAARLTQHLPELRHPMARMVGPLNLVFQATVRSRAVVPLDALDEIVHDPHPWLAATARVMRAHLALNFGDRHTDAEADFRIALREYRKLGERWGIAFSLSSLASMTLRRGEYAEAVAYYQEALSLIDELGTTDDQVQFQTQLARALWLLGEREQARDLLTRAQREAAHIGLPETRCFVAYSVGELARLDGDLSLARSHLHQAAALAGRRWAPQQLRAVVAGSLSQIAVAEGEPAAARAHYAEAIRAAAGSFDAPVIAQVLVAGADLAVLGGDPSSAAVLLGAGAAIRGTTDLSLVDCERIAGAARGALGEVGFEQAYRRGLTATMGTVRDLPGVDLADGPAVTAG